MKDGGARIVGGVLGGRRLAVARGTRPSSALLRGALASIWSDRLAGARVLDLYAGSGAVALELLSRGAAAVTLVESSRAAGVALAANSALAPAGSVRLLSLPAERAVRRLVADGERFDLLFVDPPYELELDPDLLAALGELAVPGAALAIERRSGSAAPAPPGWRSSGGRRYGEAQLHLFEKE